MVYTRTRKVDHKREKRSSAQGAVISATRTRYIAMRGENNSRSKTRIDNYFPSALTPATAGEQCWRCQRSQWIVCLCYTLTRPGSFGSFAQSINKLQDVCSTWDTAERSKSRGMGTPDLTHFQNSYGVRSVSCLAGCEQRKMTQTRIKQKPRLSLSLSLKHTHTQIWVGWGNQPCNNLCARFIAEYPLQSITSPTTPPLSLSLSLSLSHLLARSPALTHTGLARSNMGMYDVKVGTGFAAIIHCGHTIKKLWKYGRSFS